MQSPGLISRALLCLQLALCPAVTSIVLVARAAAQAVQSAPLQLVLGEAQPPVLDRERLRTQLERELGVPVALVAGESSPDAAPHAREALIIAAPSLAQVQLRFAESVRTVDLESAGPHAEETLALIAANLMRDEASELLASLRTPKPSLPVPPAQPAPAPAVANQTQTPAPPSPPPERRGCAPSGFRRVPFSANLLPSVGTSTHYGRQIEQQYALHLIGGSAEALDGFELSGGFNHESHGVCGVQISGALNLVDGPVAGVQLSTVNVASGRVDGAQLATFNLSGGSLHGAQAGFVNLALRDAQAAQLAFVNVAAGQLQGAQLGFANVAVDDSDAVQVSFANVSAGALRGAQVGFANVVAGDLTGVQLAFANVSAGRSRGAQVGFVNVTAERSSGLMLGFVNSAEDADAAIGVLNFYTKGRTQLDVWATDAGIGLVGIEHGGRVLHNILGVGATSRNGRAAPVFAYGLGARVHQSASLFVDIDALGYALLQPRDGYDDPAFASILQLRVPISLRLSQSFALTLSPALNLSIARERNNPLRDPSLYGTRVTSRTADVASHLWPGLTLGLRVF